MSDKWLVPLAVGAAAGAVVSLLLLRSNGAALAALEAKLETRAEAAIARAAAGAAAPRPDKVFPAVARPKRQVRVSRACVAWVG